MPSNSISREEMAANYGWALSFLKSNKELWKLFNKAVDGSWSTNRFVAALRNTKWFKKNSDTYRQAQVLKKTDPKTYAQRVAAKRQEIADLAIRMGAPVPGRVMEQVTNSAIWFNYNEAQLREILGNYIAQEGQSGHYGGEAGEAENELRKYADDMGVSLSDSTLKTWLQQIVKIDQTVEDYKGYIQGLAESQYSVWADRIKAGQTVREIASPYMELMAQTLELNPADIDLKTPEIRQALQTVGPDGKPMAKTMWQFGEDLRKDQRWLQTDNARNALLSVGRQVLKDFGLQS